MVYRFANAHGMLEQFGSHSSLPCLAILPWLAFSQHQSPIENVWCIMKSKIVLPLKLEHTLQSPFLNHLSLPIQRHYP